MKKKLKLNPKFDYVLIKQKDCWQVEINSQTKQMPTNSTEKGHFQSRIARDNQQYRN